MAHIRRSEGSLLESAVSFLGIESRLLDLVEAVLSAKPSCYPLNEIFCHKHLLPKEGWCWVLAMVVHILHHSGSWGPSSFAGLWFLPFLILECSGRWLSA